MFYFVCNCGGKRPGNPNLCICWAKGPIRELKVARGQEKHFRKGSMLISEGMKSNRNHPRSNLRNHPPSARQCRGENVWSAIKSDIPDHSMEQDKC